MSKKSGFIEGVLLGFLGGIVAGILFAPSSGDETRRKFSGLSEGGSDEKESSDKEQTEALISKTLQAIDRGFEKVNRILDDSKKSVEKSIS